MRGKVKYQKELQNTYLIMEEGRKEIVESYRGQTVLRDRIRGLAKCRLHLIDGRWEIWYDVSFLQSLEQVFAVKELVYHDLKRLILHIIQVIHEMERYLLDGGQLCFEPAYLYWDLETASPVFIYDFTEEKAENSLRILGEFILERTSHKEEKTVDLAYFFYESLSKESFSIKEVEQYIEEQGDHTKSQTAVAETEPDNPDSKTIGETRKLETEPCVPDTLLLEQYRETADDDRQLTEEKLPSEKEAKKSERAKGMQSYFNNRKNITYAESGLVCILAAALLGIGYVMAERYYILEVSERIIWVGIFLCLAVAGLVLFGWGKKACKEKNERGSQCESVISTDLEEDFWQQQEAESTAYHKEEEKETDQKTVYIGKGLINREYNLISLKKGEQKEYPVKVYPFLVGKDKEKVHLYVRDHSVSRIHARLLEENGSVYIEDLHSTNGTYVNDLALCPHEKVKIKRGDVILFGMAEFAFR